MSVKKRVAFRVCSLAIFYALLPGCAQQSAVINDESDEDLEDAHYSSIHDAFDVHDTDGNGYLDQQEFVQLQNDPAIVRARQKIPEVEMNPFLFEEVDENADGQISQEELTRAIFPILPAK